MCGKRDREMMAGEAQSVDVPEWEVDDDGDEVLEAVILFAFTGDVFQKARSMAAFLNSITTGRLQDTRFQRSAR